jgi:hypothetical protein
LISENSRSACADADQCKRRVPESFNRLVTVLLAQGWPTLAHASTHPYIAKWTEHEA